MIVRQRLRQALAFWAVAMVLSPLFPVQAAPADKPKASCQLEYCGSKRVPANGWGYLHFDVTNPTPRPIQVRLTLNPRAQRNATIFSHEFTLGANSRYKGRVALTVGTVKWYDLQFYADGDLIQSEETLLELPPESSPFLLFLNDDINLSIGTIAKNDLLREKYLTGTTRAEKVPDHYAGFGEAHMVIVERPDFAAYSTRQLTALREWVAHGGTLLFADPQGALDAYRQTLVRRLIPVVPLRTRTLEQLDALTTIGGTTLTWPEGVTFLESVPASDTGVTTLSAGGFPLVHWARYGLGRVGICAVNPSDPAIQAEAQTFANYWNHLLAYGGQSAFASSRGDAHIVTALDHITGIKMPPAWGIRLFLAIYSLVVLIIIVAGIVTKKRVLAWSGLAILAIGATIMIFVLADYRARALSTHTAATLDFQTYGTDDAAGEQLVSLFLKQDEQLDLSTLTPDTMLRGVSMPTVTGVEEENALSVLTRQKEPSGARGKTKEEVAETGESHGQNEALTNLLQITTRVGRSHLDKLLIRTYTPRMLTTLYTRPGSAGMALPTITWEMSPGPWTTRDASTLWQRSGPRMADWQIPAGIVATHAFLVTGSGYYPVTLRNGICSIVPGAEATQQVLEVSPEIAALRDYLSTQDLPAPLLALIGSADQEMTGLFPAQFDVVGRRLHLVPVIEDRTAEQADIPGQRIEVLPTRTYRRMLTSQGQWLHDETIKGNATRDFGFEAYLPPGYNRLAPNRIVVYFDAVNRGANLNFEVMLRDPTQPAPSPRNGKAKDAAPTDTTGYVLPLRASLSPEARAALGDNPYYVFENVGSHLIDPSDGRLEIVVRVSTRESYTDDSIAKRMNQWIIREFEVAVSGALPIEQRGRF